MKRLNLAVTTAILVAVPASAQEAINTDAALQPPPGTLIVRQQFRYFDGGDDPTPAGRDVDRFVAVTSFVYGLTPEVTLIGNIPLVYRNLSLPAPATGSEDFGLADPRILAKVRLFKNDFGINSTARISALGGLEFPSGDDTFSSDSLDPLLGVVGTFAADRHGSSLALLYKINTGGDDDTLKWDAAYTFRLRPAEFGAGPQTAIYGVLELNGLSDVGGQHQLFLSPGAQFVTGRWTIEGTVQIPVWQDLQTTVGTDLGLGLIIRMKF